MSDLRLGHWRNSALSVKFFFIEGLACLPLLLFILHIRWWTFYVSVSAVAILVTIRYFGYTVPVAWRALKTWFGGRIVYKRRQIGNKRLFL